MQEVQHLNEKTKLAYDELFEERIYNECEQRGYFEIQGNINLRTKDSEPFCIMMPPPNVTGILHIGHALTFTLQDILVRAKRMQGFKVLWQPGLDHAGIATQNIVEKELLKQGIKKDDLTREQFIQKVWEWKEQSGGQILKQMRVLGFSPAFKRTRFTMDDGLKNAVKKVFVEWYNKGLIFKSTRMINWCIKDGALSDIEVDYKENNSKLYYIKYFLESKNEYLSVATSRPETLFGDVALMVNGDDERYKHLVGKQVILPLANKKIPIIADSYVDKDFGSGVVKVTPAHDNNDYEVGKRHNLESIIVFDKFGILNENAGEFCNIDRLQAREQILKKLKSLELLEKVEEYKNNISTCYRCNGVIEPYISTQWFVKKQVADLSIKEVNAGSLRFFPSSWKNNYNAWMRDLKDWCISRQLWWGHRIPVFYCECGEQLASEEDNPTCPKCGATSLRQDEDVLDTWFSSGLWSHSTLGYGNGEFGKGTLWNEDDLESFHPNSLLITGFDILFFWVARMLLSSYQNLNEVAFKDVYLHALVLDEFGAKMSKSKGNVINPLALAKEYSPDIIRFSLAFLCAQGRDIRLSNKQLDITRNFTNKLINASAFLKIYKKQLNISFIEREGIKEYKTPLGIYAKSRLNLATKEINEAISTYRFDLLASAIYRFLWSEFCDNFIELAKAYKDSVAELGSVFIESMKLLHPLMPFISEYIFHDLLGRDIHEGLKEHKSIMIESFPKEQLRDASLEMLFGYILDAITTIRRLKLSYKDIDTIYIKLDSNDINKELFSLFTCKLAKINELIFIDEVDKAKKLVGDVGEFSKCYARLEEGSINKLKDSINLKKQKAQKEILKLTSMLNANFIQNAPKNVVEQKTKELESAREKLKKLEDEENNLASIS